MKRLYDILKVIYIMEGVIVIKHVIKDKKYRFVSVFDDETGAYIRTGIIDENGKDTGVDPFMASYPHLIDVGIMGHCIHGKTGLCAKAGIGCYQSGMLVQKPNMNLEDFRSIVEQSKGKCNQFALGGRGDPDQHEHSEEILKLCRENHIVPNFTTSGYGMNKDLAQICKKYCGAVAVSWYRSEYTYKAIKFLLEAKVKTNIHYVLGNNSIDEAINRLKNDSFPKGINSVVFLLHKPVGQGKQDNVLNPADPKVKQFFEEVDKGGHSHQIGIDSCNAPGIVNFCKKVMLEAIDTCEGGRYSCYITPDMYLLPCSFDQERKYAVSLRENTIEEAWNSKPFNDFRSILKNSCKNCQKRSNCMGGCPLHKEIVLCKEINKHE